MISRLSLFDLQQRFGGKVINGNAVFSSVSTDSRNIQSGDAFIALVGEHFDAHDFISSLHGHNVSALIVDREIVSCSLSQWVVSDTTEALGTIAKLHRELFVGALVAITGSGGKTTVKGMLQSILSSSVGGHHVLATKGNFNNHIGMPLSLLSLESEHQYAVIEMGASALGEIDYLTHIASPDVALVNNVMPAHIEGFGSIDNIATAKGEIYEGLVDAGIAIINMDERYSSQWLLQNKQRNVLTFSINGDSDANVVASDIQVNANGSSRFTLKADGASVNISLKVLGLHNVANAVAAAACAFALGIRTEYIARGLNAFSAVSGRLECLEGVNNSLLIDDSYNANPGSVKAAIDVLSELDTNAGSANRVLILGDLGELGCNAQEYHVDLGAYARDKKIDVLLSVGSLSRIAATSFGDKGETFNSHQELINIAEKMAEANTIFLIKGSRSSRMDRVVQALKQRGDHNATLVG